MGVSSKSDATNPATGTLVKQGAATISLNAAKPIVFAQFLSRKLQKMTDEEVKEK